MYTWMAVVVANYYVQNSSRVSPDLPEVLDGEGGVGEPAQTPRRGHSPPHEVHEDVLMR